jgi:lipoate-protein ligase A
MAVDEALLERHSEREVQGGCPTVRIYAWSPAAISLGRQQPAPPAARLCSLREHGIDLVRRPTGGRDVYHEQEWTYAVAGRIGRGPFPGGVLDTYRRISEAVMGALEWLGATGLSLERGRDPGPEDPRSCFEVSSAHEITLGPIKVVGSAQARRRCGFLQQGSIPFGEHGGRPLPGGARETSAEQSPLATLLGGRPTRPRMIEAFRAGFHGAFGVDLLPGELTEEEEGRAAILRCWKYDSYAWTMFGRIGSREKRWAPELVEPINRVRGG